MPAPPPTPDPPNRPDPHQDRPATVAAGRRPETRARSLLGLVRNLIDYAKALAGVLQRPETAANPRAIVAKFGTRDLALIAARITRGILLAVALEARLIGRVALEDKPPKANASPPPVRDPSARKLRKPRQPTRRPDDSASLLARMPTAEEIAAQIRRRPIGAVIVDICYDLGIGTNYPEWRELRDAINFNGGSDIRFMRDLFSRFDLLDTFPPDMPLIPPMPPGWRPPPRPWFAEALGTGPP